jgi:hypothetical protein
LATLVFQIDFGLENKRKALSRVETVAFDGHVVGQFSTFVALLQLFPVQMIVPKKEHVQN